jgi:hypothetical protein
LLYVDYLLLDFLWLGSAFNFDKTSTGFDLEVVTTLVLEAVCAGFDE